MDEETRKRLLAESDNHLAELRKLIPSPVKRDDLQPTYHEATENISKTVSYWDGESWKREFVWDVFQDHRSCLTTAQWVDMIKGDIDMFSKILPWVRVSPGKSLRESMGEELYDAIYPAIFLPGSDRHYKNNEGEKQ